MPDPVAGAAEAPAVVAPTSAPSAPPAGEIPAAAAETPAVPAGEKPAAPDDDPAKQDRARHRRQLNTAYRKAAEAQARADLLQKQIEELRPKAPEGAPKLEDFKDIEEYATAKAKHESERAVKEHQSKQQSESQKQAQARLIEQWEDKVDGAADKYPDWTDVVGDLKPTAPWVHAAMEADNGPDILYHLGKNLEEAKRINGLSPTAQIREIGKLEAKLAAEPAKPKAPSRAPAPITPLTGAAPAASDAPSDQDDLKTWMRKRSKQVHGSRK